MRAATSPAWQGRSGAVLGPLGASSQSCSPAPSVPILRCPRPQVSTRACKVAPWGQAGCWLCKPGENHMLYCGPLQLALRCGYTEGILGHQVSPGRGRRGRGSSLCPAPFAAAGGAGGWCGQPPPRPSLSQSCPSHRLPPPQLRVGPCRKGLMASPYLQLHFKDVKLKPVIYSPHTRRSN